MILGVGLDVVEVDRVERAVSRQGEMFLEEILNRAEVDRARRSARFCLACAAAFAAKEALLKAVGTGRAGTISWRDMEVVGSLRTPRIVLGGETARVAARLGVSRVSLGLAHAGGLAAAMVVLEGAPPRAEEVAGDEDPPPLAEDDLR
jgi:holo-[acyl-carrier protein] synthase